MNYKHLIYFLRFGAILLVTLTVNDLFSVAQQPNQWPPQQRIPDVYAVEKRLVMVPDQNRTVHAVNHQQIDGEDVIVYFQWTLEQGWTPPIDILLGNDIQVLDAFLDQAGMMHIVFKLDGDIYYSRSPAVNAGQASAWLKPEFVGENPTIPYNAAITGDDKGNLVVIYGGNRDGNGVYAIYSDDGGNIWSDSESVFFTFNNTLVVMDAQVYMGQSGRLHAVWTVVNDSGIGESGHYAGLEVDRRQWDIPIDLDEAVWLGIRTPSVIEYGGDILVSYYNGRDNANWWRRSSDSGRTWTDPVRVSPRHVGTNGAISFVVDSNDVLHLFFGQRINDDNHGIWHSVWQGYGWTEPEAVVRGAQSSVLNEEFDPRDASAVAVQGNAILVAWTTDGMVSVHRAVDDVFYAYTLLDVPELPVVPLPIPPATPTSTPTPTVTPSLFTSEPSSTPPVLTVYQNEDSAVITSDPEEPLIISIVAVTLLISVFVIVRQWYKSGRY